YRKKRNNAYGDEVIPPATDLTVPIVVPVEQAPAQAEQSYGAAAAAAPPPVEASGY
uniref:Preprotein translocase subunit SecG n=1 Tax=Elaeophora elaphi TaxID=1147741 RepID=A0A0R3RUZ9_9BILA